MPAFGHQHQNRHDSSVNSPYARTRWTSEEAGVIATKLNTQLGPEFVSTRPNGGGRVAYIEGWKVLNLANEIFGFNGWNSEIMEITTDFCDEVGGRYNIGVSVKVRVSLKDGTFREDVGYGQIENSRSKAAAFDKCRKEATTDAMKRALRQFGNALGNCLYDSSYRANISRVTKPAPHFDADGLLRMHAVESTGASSSSTSSVVSIPTTVPLSHTINNNATSRNALSEHSKLTPSVKTEAPHISISTSSITGGANFVQNLPPGVRMEDFDMSDEYSPAGEDEIEPILPEDKAFDDLESTEMPVQFFSARAAEIVQANKSVPQGSQFNPDFVSPSIPRTIDHTKSAPIKRSEVAHLATKSQARAYPPPTKLGAPRILQSLAPNLTNNPVKLHNNTAEKPIIKHDGNTHDNAASTRENDAI